MKKMRLYCFSYAGGSAVIYNQLQQTLKEIEVIPVEYAGRGKRFKEKLYNDVNDAADDMFKILESELDGHPYALLGYSLGALITYELMKRIIQHGKSLPLHIFFMACHAPHRRYGDYDFHRLSDKQLADTLLKIGGINESIYQNQELLNVFIPIIKNDFKVYETYDFHQKKIELPSNISIIVASKDKLITIDDARDWECYAGKDYQVGIVDGDHFFIHEKHDIVAKIIIETLQLIRIPM